MNFIYRFNQDPDRPVQVTYAVLLLYALLVLEIAHFLIQTVIFYISHQAEFTLGGVILGSLVYLTVYMLMFFVVRKIADGKNWARLLILIGFAANILINACRRPSFISGDAISGIVTAGILIGTALAIALLFQKSSNNWFNPKSKDQGYV